MLGQEQSWIGWSRYKRFWTLLLLLLQVGEAMEADQRPDNTPSSSSDISDDETRAELLEQAQFEQLEAALDRTFGQSSAPERRESDDDSFFDDPIEDTFRLYVEDHHQEVLLADAVIRELSLDVGSQEEVGPLSAPPPVSPSKRVTPGNVSKRLKIPRRIPGHPRTFTLDDGRREIERRLREMRRTEIDQVKLLL